MFGGSGPNQRVDVKSCFFIAQLYSTYFIVSDCLQSRRSILITGTRLHHLEDVAIVYCPCHNHVLIAGTVHCSTTDLFGFKQLNSVICLILSESFFLCLTTHSHFFFTSYYTIFSSLAFRIRRSHCSYPSSSLSALVFISIQHLSVTFF